VSRDSFVLATDSCCDLPAELAEALGLVVLEFPFTVDGEQRFDDLGRSMTAATFYAAMRDGAMPTTAQVPMAEYVSAFTAAADDGIPLLFMSLSSGLSGTYDASLVARDCVLADHPRADIRVVDTLCASAQQGLLVLGAARRRDAGFGFDELGDWVESNRGRVNGYFTVDTLESLRRGGRVSDLAAFAGTVLDVRPILRMSAEGELVVDRPVRGRRKSLRVIADIFEGLVGDPAEGTVVVAHGDAPNEARALEELLRERADIDEALVFEVGPVVGSHTGPGMVAAVFWGPERAS
jgi:DegV family protein with EDD domain